MLVKIINYMFDEDPNAKYRTARQTPGCSLQWENIEFTLEDIDECDLVVVLGFLPKDIKIRARQIWLLQQEPPMESVWGWQKSCYKYFDKVFGFWGHKNMIAEQTSLNWFMNKTYDELKELKISEKADKVSFCVSNLCQRPGHIARIDFKDYLQSTDLDFDLFGRGFNQVEDKFDAINPYKYSIAIENYFTKGYWTEKISDCFLCNTMPIYAGATDILKYFPKEALVIIDPYKKQESYEIIKDAVESKLWEKNIESIREAKDLCLNKYQIFPNIKRLFDENEVMKKPLKTYKLPKTKNFEEMGKVYVENYFDFLRHKPLKAIFYPIAGKIYLDKTIKRNAI